MWFVPILAICLQPEVTSNPLPRANVVLAAPLHNLVSLAQTATPTAVQATEPSKSPEPAAVPPSPEAAPNTVPKQLPSTSPTKKKPTTSYVRKKARLRKSPPKPNKVVVRNGSTTDPSVQFSTTASPEQAAHERQNTARLLATTNANLQKLLGHQLDPNQQDTLAQIRSYMQQAKSAEDAGDLQSARNLAQKAQLLSTQLIRK